MAKKSQDNWAREELGKHLAILRAELDLWHKMYPRQVHGMQEEALAKIEGREPKHLPPMAFGASAPAGEGGAS